MSLAAHCPRCPNPVEATPAGWRCALHGRIVPLWRPSTPGYDAFGAHLLAAGGFPTYLPWPLTPGWRVSDFGVVGQAPDRVSATLTCWSGPTEMDGPVDVLLVAEEPGTGLGARCAGFERSDPGPEVGRGRPSAHVRVDQRAVALWPVSTVGSEESLDRSVVVGEAFGRWLWLVLRPASAVLLLGEDWLVHDVSDLGPALVEVEFGGPAPAW